MGSRNGDGVEEFSELLMDGQLYARPTNAVQGVMTSAGSGIVQLLTGIVQFSFHYGSANQGPDGTLHSLFPTAWPLSSAGRGIAWAALHTDFDPSVHRGKPEWTSVIKGSKCYDPRDGIWKWTTNPALIAMDYLLDPICGPGVAIDDINISDVIDLANESEVQVFAGDKSNFDQFACNARLDTAKTWQENLAAIQSSFPGWIYKEGDQWRMKMRKVATPVSYVLTDDEIIGDFAFHEKGPKDGANSVDVSFVDAGKSWETENLKYPDDVHATPNQYKIDDGGADHPVSLQLPCETNRWRAVMHAARMIREVRDSIVITCEAKESALQLSVGDVVTVDVDALGSLSPMEFWVYGIEPRQNATVGLLLVSYHSDAYLDFTQQSTIDSITTASLPVFDDATPADVSFQATVPDPTDLALTATLSCVDVANGVASVTATWDQTGGFVDHHLIRYRAEPSDAWVDVGSAPRGLNSFTFDIPVAQASYRIEVLAVSINGTVSSPIDDANWGASTTIDLTDYHTAADASGVVPGDFSHTTNAGVVTTTFTPSGTNGRTFDLHVSASTSFTATSANRVGRAFGADGTAVQWSYVPPVAGQEDYYFKVVISDCFTVPLGETPSVSSEFSATYAGLNVVTDPGATSCVNLAVEYGEHCAPADMSSTAAEVAGDPYELIDLEAHCVPVGSRLSVGFDAYVVCSGSGGLIDQNTDGSLALTIDGRVVDQDFSLLSSLDGSWSVTGSPYFLGGNLMVPAGARVIYSAATASPSLVVYAVMNTTLVTGADGAAFAAVDAQNGYITSVRTITGGSNHYNRGRITGGTVTYPGSNTPWGTGFEPFGISAITGVSNVALEASSPDDDWSHSGTDTDHFGSSFKPGIAGLSTGTDVACARLQAMLSRTITVTGLTNMKIRVIRSGDPWATDVTVTTGAQTGTGTITFTGTNTGGGAFHTIRILDAGAGDAIVAEWTPARGVWGGDQYAFQPVAQTCNNIEAEMAWAFLEADGSTVVSSGVSSRTNATAPGVRVTIEGTNALTRPAGSRYLQLTPWKRNVAVGYICTDNVKVNQGTTATPFSTPFQFAGATLSSFTTTGDPGLTVTGGSGEQFVTQAERAAIATSGANLLAPGDTNAGSVESLTSSDQYSRIVTYSLTDLGRSAGEDIAFTVRVASATGADDLRAVVVFKDDADAVVQGYVGSTVTGSSLTSATLSTVIPTGATQIEVYAENVDMTEAWTVGARTLVHGPLAREFSPSPIYPRSKDAGNSGSAITLDFSEARMQLVTLTAASVAITVTGLAEGDEAGLLVRQDSTGSRAITAPGIAWASGVEQQPSTGALSYTLYGLANIEGTVWVSRVGTDMRTPGVTLTGEIGTLGFVGQTGDKLPFDGTHGTLGLVGQDAGVQRIMNGTNGTLGFEGQEGTRVIAALHLGDYPILQFQGLDANIVTDGG